MKTVGNGVISRFNVTSHNCNGDRNNISNKVNRIVRVRVGGRGGKVKKFNKWMLQFLFLFVHKPINSSDNHHCTLKFDNLKIT